VGGSVTPIAALISGLLAAGYAIAGLFFLQFARQAADRLFFFFALAFWLLAAQRILMTVWAHDETTFTLLYGLRAFAFLLILYAILDKNRRASA
jgi:hypothetical protein